MILSTSYKSNQFLWLVFKVAIAFACFYYLSSQFTENVKIHPSIFLSNLIDFQLFSIKNISFLLFFTFFNWFLEIFKWKLLVSTVKIISWSDALKQSLSSLAFSLITPNRIGEYGAKAYFFEKKHWRKVLVLNGLGNGFQLFATIIFGFIGILVFWNHFLQIFSELNFATLIVLSLITLFLLMFKSVRKQFQKLNIYLKSFDFKFLTRIGMISIIRYIIFSHQFYLILFFIDSQISYPSAISAIFLIYFISSCTPMLSLLDVVLKSSLAIWILAWIDIDVSVALTASVLMWVLNFALPSLVGSMYILRLPSKWN